MPASGDFLDSNVLCYLFGTDDAKAGVLVTAVQKVPLSNSLESRRLKHFSRRKYLILLMAKVFQFAFLIWAAGGPPSRRRPR